MSRPRTTLPAQRRPKIKAQAYATTSLRSELAFTEMDLIRMNRRAVETFELAFECGLEQRASAAAQIVEARTPGGPRRLLPDTLSLIGSPAAMMSEA